MYNIKDHLDLLVERYNTEEFIKDDPVQFPHRYKEKRDIEIVSFLIATIAWGKRSMILNSSNRLLNIMGVSPFDFIMSDGYERLDPAACVHRTFFNRDLIYYCKGLKDIYLKYDFIEDLFTLGGNHDTWQGIQYFRDAMQKANFNESSKHISNPSCEMPNKGSACKRLHLALRWLVRDDGIVDLGIWKKFKPSDLMIPLDVHVARVSRAINLLTRKSNDRQAVEQLTERLRQFDSEDPVRYDFALFAVELDENNTNSLISN